MDIREIYYLYGYINMNGTIVNNPDYKTYIVECKIGNSTGYSHYSFYTEKTIYDITTTNINIIKLENLFDLVEDSNIIVERMTDVEKKEKYKKIFEFFYHNQEKFIMEETEGKNL